MPTYTRDNLADDLETVESFLEEELERRDASGLGDYIHQASKALASFRRSRAALTDERRQVTPQERETRRQDIARIFANRERLTPGERGSAVGYALALVAFQSLGVAVVLALVWRTAAAVLGGVL